MTLKQFYEKFRKKHQLQLIAGEKGIYTSFKWIYLLEDLNNMSFIRGGELIITTGLANSYDHWLEELIHSVNKKGASGIILNIGNYIKDIPHYLIDYCNNNHLPLLIMPWEIHIADIMQDGFNDIIKEKQEEEYFSKIFSNAIFDNMIDNAFIAEHEDMKPYSYSTYGIVAFKNVSNDKLTVILNQAEQKYLLLTKKTTQYAILYNITENNFAATLAFLHSSLSTDDDIHCGISTLGQGLQCLFNKRIEADKALQVAIATKKPHCFYNNLGLYQIILGISDETILDNLYTQSLKTIVDYDQKHNSNYLEILRYYIEFNSSVQLVAEHTFTHRNTINYRVAKIKKLLQSDLSSMEERCRIRLAFCLYDLQHSNTVN
ncbi:PucR family transcriptional regulator [Sporomusa sphaeroides]|uniref:Purine catabolism regulatory protein n=1 Tax=Sporomusa sphaeroides DSM 2875 TaxID=1337886 RepID=A0ABM9W6P0_9FIRM|nr:PucR family transcriptional regulator [Sporomusa sphaeroides]OLS57596.1 purine catabolism regulatory protein [Sporomusa sphaeroides DSM 2875]CVK20708.1 Purine catabolism regulatory protein [Sporomusa sphaeroides DSM 2875]